MTVEKSTIKMTIERSTIADTLDEVRRLLENGCDVRTYYRIYSEDSSLNSFLQQLSN
jgi:hypothetical protein